MTYIPKSSKNHQTGMLSLIPYIQNNWTQNLPKISESAHQITQELKKIFQPNPSKIINSKTLNQSFQELQNQFDPNYGGFGSAPKFPMAHSLSFLLRYWKKTQNPHALNMVTKTLDHMRQGGIFDQLGSGFHRYSTDTQWFLPHFEKMLYDQASLSIAYLETFQATQIQKYSKVAKEIFAYVLSNLTSPQGAFYSAEDADSDGIEGQFYTWSFPELQNILTKPELDLATNLFGITKDGNFSDEATSQKIQKNILSLNSLNSLKNPSDQIAHSQIVQKLLKARNQRNRPNLDDKILTDWNGFMIAALAQGTRILNDPQYLNAAKLATQFLFQKCYSTQSQLFHRYRDNQASIQGQLNDYAFLTWGLIEIYQTSFEKYYLEKALELNDYILKYFLDTHQGGFFLSINPDLLLPTKEIHDGAIPSGTSVATLNLLKLARITGNLDFFHHAEKIIQAFGQNYQKHPSYYLHMMQALDFVEGPTYEIVLTGQLNSTKSQNILKSIQKQFIPNKVLLWKSQPHELDHIAPFTQNMKVQTEPLAYICKNTVCQPPTSQLSKIMELIDQK